MEVLVIGRNRQNLKTISLNLRALNPSISIKTVENGLSGIQELKTNTPHLAVVNSVLPDIESCDLVKKIREFSDVPIMVFCRAEVGMKGIEVLEAGADEYIADNTSSEDFKAKLKALIRRTYAVGMKPGFPIFAGDKPKTNIDSAGRSS